MKLWRISESPKNDYKLQIESKSENDYNLKKNSEKFFMTIN